jgi:4'-phosphopantetheinyl transferase
MPDSNEGDVMSSPYPRAPLPVWQPGPERPLLLPAVVDVWRIRLDGSPARQAGVDTLSERGRARAAMTRILAACLDREAAELVVERPGKGKPRVASPAIDLRFNLSHTRGMALLAVATGIDVGIDIEVARDVPNRLAMARRVFPPSVVASLGLLDDHGQNRAFLSAWTAMEARQKTFGRGIFESRVDDTAVQGFGFAPAPGWLAHVAVDAAAGPVEFRYFDATGP